MKNNLRYGIRKHKLGAASVFLGTMIVVGMGQDKEAAASEQNTTVEESGSSATESKASETQTTTNNVNTIDETQSYSATSTEQPSKPTQVTTEEAPQTVQAPKVETSRVDLPSEKVVEKETTGTQVDTTQPSNVSEIKPRMKRSADVAEVAEKEVVEKEVKATGTDVTSKVTVEEGSEIVGHNNKETKVVNPHNAERVTLKYKWKFGEDIKPGDYFDFTLSNNVETHGISPLRKVPDIKSKDDNIVAVGHVLDERKIRYIFKEYVKDKKDLTAELSLNLFIDPTTVTKQGKQTIEVKLGENKISKEFDIKYLDGVKDNWGVTVNGRITLLDKENSKIHHLAYINPKKSDMTSITINGIFAKGGLSTGNVPTVKVYEYLGSDELPESVYANTNDQEKFKDVTNDMSDKLTLSENGSYKLTLDALNKKSYVVSFEGKYNENDKELLFRTNLHGYHANYGYYYYYPVNLTWDNGVAFYSNNAQGDGKDKPNDPIIEKSEPIDLDIKSEQPVEKHELTGTIEENDDSKPIDFEYHTAVEGAEGHAEGIVKTEEDSIHVDFEESTHENSKHHADVVEYEEDTNPGGGQVTTESNLVEFDEDSTNGIVTGAVSDHTTVEDTKEYTTESNLIELVDELPEEHGQAQGPIEEITENNHHISHSGLGTENGHGNYGVIEEIEENSQVDIKSELGYEGGQNSGNQSFEEDTEEDKPKYEQGGNIVDIDFDSVPQIHGQNKGDQSFEEDTEKDKPKYEQGGNIIDIDFDSVPHIHGFNKHTEIIEEDTNKDKPNYQFGGHNSVDFVEDTIPQVSGHNEGQQTIEEDTTPPAPEVPSEPEKPTPPTPEVPSEPETPTPPTPEVPSEPGKPVPPAKEEPKKPSKPVEQGKVVTPVIEINEKVKAVKPAKEAQPKKSELPETGVEESTNKGMLFGGLFSILGLALLRRNKKNNKA
ncbi:fibronectin-binding protein FnbB [Staphylococcus sp. SS35]|nr:fibronectin-binding protein FnbB [Staphylococcus singaporensis]